MKDELFQDGSFDKIDEVLYNIYARKEGCNVQSITPDIKLNETVSIGGTVSIGTQLIELIGKICKVTKYLMSDQGMNFFTDMPLPQQIKQMTNFWLE